MGTAGALGTVAVAASAVPASAATSYRPAHYRGDPLLRSSSRLLVSRFSYGVTPDLARQVRSRGGAARWFEWQLTPARIDDPATADLESWWPGPQYEGMDAWTRQIQEVEPGWRLMFHYQRWLLQRRLRERDVRAGRRGQGRPLLRPLARSHR